MPDMTAFTAATATIGAIYRSVQSAMEIAKRLDNAEMRLAISDAIMSIAQVKMELAQALEDNIQLRAKLEEARNIAAMRANLVQDGKVYKLRKPLEGYGEGPFCTRCFDAEGVLITMHPRNGRNGVYYVCSNCPGKRRSH